MRIFFPSIFFAASRYAFERFAILLFLFGHSPWLVGKLTPPTSFIGVLLVDGDAHLAGGSGDDFCSTFKIICVEVLHLGLSNGLDLLLG